MEDLWKQKFNNIAIVVGDTVFIKMSDLYWYIKVE